MKVLITGAAGFVGRHVVHSLVEQGQTVRAVVHDREKAWVRLGEAALDVEIVVADVTDRSALEEAARGMEVIVHLAAIPIEKGDATYERINFQGTVNVVDAAVAAGVSRFIILSQNGANAKSFSPFMRSKGKADDYLAGSPLQWTMLHPSLVFGPGDKVFNELARLIRLTPFVFPEVQGGRTEFQPVLVHDLVKVISHCLHDEQTIGEHYNLGGPEVLTLGEIIRRVLDVLEERRLLIPMPAALLEPPTYLMHHLLPRPPASVVLLRLLRVPNVVLHANAFPHFGITPRPFAGEHLTYLRETSAREALRHFLSLKPD